MTMNFDKSFIWGAATAAFQIEGHDEEYQNKLSDWANWIDTPDKVKAPSGDGMAIKHIDHLDEDLDLMKELGIQAYRFSFNWAMLHRAPDQFDDKTIAFYHKLLEGLEARGIEAYATLEHFTLPIWISDTGGWTNADNAKHFESYTKLIVKEFGRYISKWITLNEPNIYLWFGYESGIWPPGKINAWQDYLKAYQGMALGHMLAYRAIKTAKPNDQIGIAQNLYAFQNFNQIKNPDEPKWMSEEAVPTALRKQLHNLAFIEICKEMDTLDFLGVNYYTRFSYKFDPQSKQNSGEPDTKLQHENTIWGELLTLSELSDTESGLDANDQNHNKPNAAIDCTRRPSTNDLSWEVYPEGLKEALIDPALLNIIGDLPVYITENGYATLESRSGSSLEDQARIDFLDNHLKAISEANDSGANVQAYFYWSLFDNFEWALGMEPRFGLIHVDYSNEFKRSPKKSFYYYQKLIKKFLEL